jgi:hypothetical protein
MNHSTLSHSIYGNGLFFKYIFFQKGFSKIEMFLSVLDAGRLYFVILPWFRGNNKIIVNPVFAHCTI